MGDIAEGLLNGDFDEITGEYLGPGQGFPRSLHYNNGPREYDSSSALYGVKNYLRKRGVTNWNNIVVAYNKDVLKIEFPGQIDNNKIAIEIQKDFGAFVKYVRSELIKSTGK